MKISHVVLAAVCLFLCGCPSHCKEACDHAAAICLNDLPDFDQDNCANNCEANLDGCKNMDDQAQCVLDAKVCADLNKCPTCLQP